MTASPALRPAHLTAAGGFTREALRGLRITAHAARAMRARAVEVEDVAACLLTPAVVEPHGGRRRYVRDGIAAVVEADARGRVVVLTVLLRESCHWSDEDARGRA